ncbi:hypothetical protein [Rhizobium sp. RHZ01]|uniref:hypothetical protein n=2 Tax=Rhizobium TaxID=379 RepID=UPI0032B159F2
MPRPAAIRSRARRDRSPILLHPALVIEGIPMFLEDEFVIRRLRARRVSISLLVAVVAFAASILMTFGLVTTVYAEESQQVSAQSATSQMAAAPTVKAVGLGAQNSVSVKLPQRATGADERITRGSLMLLAALVATCGLAIWRRRLHGVFAGASQ